MSTATAGVRDRILRRLLVMPGEPAGIADRDPGWTGGPEFAGLAQDELEQRAKDALRSGIKELSEAQELLWASDRYAVLVVLQAMDAAGKDSAIEHVMSGREPPGGPGRLIQEALLRGARPQLPLAHLEGAARARADRHLNPSHYEEVVGADGAPRVARATAAPAR